MCEGQRRAARRIRAPRSVNAFMRAATRGELFACRWTYAELAAYEPMRRVGDIHTLKNARRRGESGARANP